MKTKQYLVILSSIVILQGCAGRNQEDFNNEQTQEHIAEAQREAGNWKGNLLGSSGAIEGGISFQSVQPDTEAGVIGANNSAAQQVGLMGAVVVTTADGVNMNYAFNNASYDITNRVMRFSGNVAMPDSTTQTVQIEAQFSDSTMTGKIWAGGWDNYGATFTLRRDGVEPAGSALSDGRNALPLATDYSATVPNPNTLDTENPTEQAELRVLSLPTSDPLFLDYFLPIVDVDLELTLGTTGTTINTAFYKSAQYNTIDKTLTGNANSTNTLNELSCNSDGGTGWLCSLNSFVATTIHFTPVQR
jgi:hypothetical protein